MTNFSYSQEKGEDIKTDSEWKNELDNLSYQVLRNSYTERPFTGEYNLHFENGAYNCKGCNQLLFKVIVVGLVLIKQFQVRLFT
jgi:hypothetical protein